MKTRRWWMCALVALLVLFTSHPAQMANEEEEESLIGEIAINDEDDEGNVLSLYLADTEEGDVLVANEGVWKDLLAHVGRTVQVWGTLSETRDPDFGYVVHVTRFSLLEDEEEDLSSEEEEEEEEE